MGENTTFCRKGRLLLAMDKLLECPTDQLKKDFEASSSVVDRGMETGVIVEADRYHCETQVLGEDADESWWPSVPDKPRIIRCAYLFAFELALDPERLVCDQARPIVTTWIAMPCEQVVFQAFVEETKNEIHVYLLTSGAINGRGMRPQPPKDAPTYVQDLWLIADAATVDAEWAKYQQQAPAYDDFEGPVDCPSDAEVKILNVPGY